MYYISGKSNRLSSADGAPLEEKCSCSEQWWDSNGGPLVWKANALPTEPSHHYSVGFYLSPKTFPIVCRFNFVVISLEATRWKNELKSKSERNFIALNTKAISDGKFFVSKLFDTLLHRATDANCRQVVTSKDTENTCLLFSEELREPLLEDFLIIVILEFEASQRRRDWKTRYQVLRRVLAHLASCRHWSHVWILLNLHRTTTTGSYLAYRSSQFWNPSSKKWSVVESTWQPSSNHWKPVCTEMRGWKYQPLESE